MGLTNWKDAPLGKIQKFDVSIAKNYLTDKELAQLQRLVNAYLDIAEDMALRTIPMTMADWEERLNRFIAATDRAILQDAGKVTAEIAKAHAESEFEKYRIVQDRLYESDFDRSLKRIRISSIQPSPALDEFSTHCVGNLSWTHVRLICGWTARQSEVLLQSFHGITLNPPSSLALPRSLVRLYKGAARSRVVGVDDEIDVRNDHDNSRVKS